MKIMFLVVSLLVSSISTSQAIPPPEDIPEEILRTEIITEGRSPVDNQLLNAAEYAELEEKLAQGKFAPQLSSKIREQVFLIQLLKMLNTINPF